MEEKAKTMKYVFNEDLFRKRLRAAMNAKGYNNAELAKVTQVSPVTIGHYLGTRSNNTRTPRGIADIYPIAKALDVSLDYLFGLTDTNSLDESKEDGTTHPRNYLDAVKLMNVLMESFVTKATMKVHEDIDDTYGTKGVNLWICDKKLASFIEKQQQLYDMVGGALSVRAFSIALDDLNEEMRKTPLETPVNDWGDIPF